MLGLCRAHVGSMLSACWDFASLQKCAFDPPEVYETCKELEEAGYAMQKAPDGGSMKGLNTTFS